MNAKHVHSWLVATACAGATLGFANQADALDTIDKGTMVVAAERMTGVAVMFGEYPNTEIAAGFLTAGIPTYYNYPRIGFDYFVIDGLSIGGSLGVNHNSGNDQTNYAILPRVGYAFALSNWIDFWPRGGIGFRGSNGNASTAVLFLEGMFKWNTFEHVGVLFGPTLDVGLASGYGSELGGSVGLFMQF